MYASGVVYKLISNSLRFHFQLSHDNEDDHLQQLDLRKKKDSPYENFYVIDKYKSPFKHNLT